jgi:pseudouridine kinase
MDEKERLVLELIKENPCYSQQELSEILIISRPELSTIISSLIKKGEMIGHGYGYVVKEHNEILAVGGANVDRKFHLEGAEQLGTSNPASVTYSVGGVARNIAENLGRLQHDVQLVTTFGQDHDMELIKSESASFIKFDYTEILHHETTGSYSAVLNDVGELVIAMADMAIYDQLLPSLFNRHEVAFTKAKLIVLDLNCPKETVRYFKRLAQVHHIPLCIVPVSVPKMKRMPKDLNGVTYFICNQDEAEAYLSMKIKSDEHCEEACEKLRQLGAEFVIITRGSKGVMAASSSSIKVYEAHRVTEIVDVTGAGDAFVSAFLHGMLEINNFEQAIEFGLVNASRTLQSNETVRQELAVDELINWREQ